MGTLSFVIRLSADQAIDIASSVSELGLSGQISKEHLAASLQAVLAEALQEYLPEDEIMIEVKPV